MASVGARARRGARPRTPGASGASTFAAQRREQELVERRRALARMFLVGAWTWPSFVALDFFVALTFPGGTKHLGYLLALRGAGTLFAIAAYMATHRLRLGPAALDTLDVAVFGTASVLLALMCVPFGGIASPLVQGVLVLASVRASLVPMPWRKLVPVTGAVLFALPATFGVLALLDPALRATWSDPRARSLFGTNFFFLTAIVILGMVVSQTLWDTRKQVFEARKLGNYRLKLRIASGAMGEVWLARQDSLDRHVALKVLKGWASDDPDAIRRFEREARAASRLKHPNTIRIFDFGASDDGVVYLAMELLDGLDLDDLVAMSGPLSAARAIHMARQACGSLAEAHAAGVIHRDIKPANLFVAHIGQEHDVIKLLDFGVARFIQTSQSPTVTETGIFSGTPAYMAPEVADNAAVDARSDLYALGAVLYFMLTGEELFPDKTVGETILLQIGQTPPTPSERLGRPVPADLERIVMRCLSKSPAERYATADELEADLARCRDAGAWGTDDARMAWIGVRSSMKMQVEKLAG